MKPRFWLERWQSNQIGFHQNEHNPLLVEFWPTLELPDDARVFVPLCGKSLDMNWLSSMGHQVVGVELAQLAIEEYFAEQGELEKESVDRFVRYRSAQTEVYQGDFFDLTTSLLEGVDAVFDRAALIALPPDMRFRYADHMLRIIPDGCRVLLITLEYDQAVVAGPPHAVLSEEVQQLFEHRCEIERMASCASSTPTTW